MSFSLFLPTDVGLLGHCARIILLFNNDPFIALSLLVGFLAVPNVSRNFGHLFLLCFFSMVLNTLLKYYFAVPLPAHLGENWYAFPSGHLQFGAIFYGWLILTSTRRWFQTALGVLLALITWATVYCGYHTWSEAIAGLAVGFSVVYGYWVLLARLRARSKNETQLRFFLASCSLVLMIGMTHWTSLENLKPHTWMGFYLVMGFAFTWRRIFELNFQQRCLAVIFGLVLVLTATQSAAMLKDYTHAIRQLPFFFLGLCLPLVREVLFRPRG